MSSVSVAMIIAASSAFASEVSGVTSVVLTSLVVPVSALT